jgi:hypothetical protein
VQHYHQHRLKSDQDLPHIALLEPTAERAADF